MRRLRVATLLFASVALLMAARASAEDFHVPALTGAVVDAAEMMDPVVRQELDAALRKLWQQGGSQIVVLTVPNLGGLAIEQASIKVTDAWKLGAKKLDNGVLLLVSKQEHGLRIEVGQGHEGQLTDVYAHRIIEDVMIPRFRGGDPTGGIVAGVSAIVGYTDPGRALGMAEPPATASSDRDDTGRSFPGWLIFMFIFILLIFHRASRGSRVGMATGLLLGGSRWGGGGGGGGAGGGGFSGGGGGFSGGGASGQW